jgi:hypothetical protein
MSENLPASEPTNSKVKLIWIVLDSVFSQLKFFFRSARLQVGWALSLYRTWPDANISVLEKVVTVLKMKRRRRRMHKNW